MTAGFPKYSVQQLFTFTLPKETERGRVESVNTLAMESSYHPEEEEQALYCQAFQCVVQTTLACGSVLRT